MNNVCQRDHIVAASCLGRLGRIDRIHWLRGALRSHAFGVSIFAVVWPELAG